MSSRVLSKRGGLAGSRLPAPAFLLLSALASLALLPAAGLEVSGRVVAADGSPIAGAQVELQRIPPFHERSLELLAGKVDWTTAVTVQSSADGGYRLAVPKPGMWQVRLAKAGSVPLRYRLNPLLESQELPDAVLEADAGLEVQIENEAGAPVEGAQVWARIFLERSRRPGARTPTRWMPVGRYGLTDRDGRVRLARKAGWRIRLRAIARGYLSAESEEFEAARVLLRLRPGVPATVRIENAAGEPVAGAALIASSHQWLTASTDERGEARVFVDPPEPLPITVRLATGQLESTEMPVLADGADGELQPQAPPAFERWRLPEPVVLSGRVIALESREPLAGALVWSPRDAGAFVVSDAEGRFRLTQGRAEFWTLQAAAAGHQKTSVQASSAPEGPRVPTLALSRAVLFEGRVLDPAENPIEGAVLRVTGRWEPTIGFTESDGSFRLPGLAAGQRFELATGANGYAPDYRSVTLTPGRSLEIVLHPGRSLVGRLSTPSGEPVAGADVHLVHVEPDPRLRSFSTRTEPVPSTETDADGRFRLDDLPRRNASLIARREGSRDKIVRDIDLVTGDEPVDLGELVMDVGIALRGRVVTRDGDSVRGAELHFSSDKHDRVVLALLEANARRRSVTTGADGDFTIPGLSRGETLSISVDHPDYVRLWMSAVDPAAEEDLEIVLDEGARVSGRALDQQGDPAARVRIVATTIDSLETLPEFTHRVSDQVTDFSDAEGHFELARIAPGQIEITAEPGHGWIALDTLSLELEAGEHRSDVVVRVSIGVTLEGTVLDSDRRPVEGASVSVQEASSSSALGRALGSRRFAAAAQTDAQGDFRILGLDRSTRDVVVSVRHPDYAELEQALQIGSSRSSVVLTLEKGAAIRGVVVAEADEPVAGAQIEVREVSSSWSHSQSSLETGLDGTFEIKGLSPGRYRLVARKPGFAESEPREVAIRDAEAPSVALRLERGGTIRGRIRGLEPHELREVDVTASHEGTGSDRGFRMASGLVSETGDFRIPNVGFSRGRVTASSESRGQSVARDFELPVSGGETWVDLDFDIGSSLSGTVFFQGKPLANARVLVHDGKKAWGSSSTNAVGAFRIRGLEDGAYRLRVGWLNKLTHSESVVVAGDTEVRIDVASIRVAGRVIAEESLEPVVGAMVGASALDDAIDFAALRAVTAAGGAFELYLPAEQRVQLLARAPGLTEGSLEIDTGSNPELTGIELRLGPAESLDLDVTIWTGQRPKMVQVALVDDAGRVVLSDMLQGLPRGRFRVGSVPAGTWRLLVASGGSAVVESVVTVPGPEVAITLPPGASLSVEASQPAGESIAGTLRLVSETGHPLSLPIHGPNATVIPFFGRATIPFVPAGNWTAELSDASGAVRRRTVTAIAGQTVRVTFD